jgi:hypothetical protein
VVRTVQWGEPSWWLLFQVIYMPYSKATHHTSDYERMHERKNGRAHAAARYYDVQRERERERERERRVGAQASARGAC